MTQYFKITNENEIHHGFQYKDGENILTEQFSKEGSCCKGGFYFTDAENITNFCEYGCYLRLVTIPEDAQMVKDPDSDKWRSDKIIFGERYPLYSLETMEKFPFLKTNEYFNNCLWYACKGRNLELAKLMIKKGATILKTCFNIVCYKGYLEIVQLFIENGIVDFNWGLLNACDGGHLEIAKLMIENGATDFNEGLVEASYSGHLEIAKLMIEKGANDYNQGLCWACDGGHLELAKLMIEKGANDYNKGLTYVRSNGNLELIEILIDKGATDFKNRLENACKGK